MLRSCACWFEQARSIIQHFLFAAWGNKEGRSSQKDVFLASDCLKGNQRRCIPSNQLATFLFLFYIQEANIYFFSAISIRSYNMYTLFFQVSLARWCACHF